MIIEPRPVFMNGMPQKSDLWKRYDTVMNGVPMRRNAFKFAHGEPEMLSDGDTLRNESYKYVQQNPALLNGIFDSSDGSPAIIDPNSVPSVIKDLVLAWNLQQIQNANAARLAQGLPALDPSAYAPTVNVGLSSQTMLILGGLLLVVLMSGRKGKR